MSLPTLASLSDLEERLGHSLPGEDLSSAQRLLRYASSLVRAYAGLSWVDDDGQLADVPGDVVDVVVEIVDRATKNPAGATQVLAGPFSRSFGADAAQRMYLSGSDKTILAAIPGRRAGLQVISTTRGPVETASPGSGDL